MKSAEVKKRITDPVLLKKIVIFLADNIGSSISVSSIGNTLVNEGLLEDGKRKGTPSAHTVQAYVNALLDAYFFYDIKRFDIKGKEFLRTLGKYYIVDIGLVRKLTTPAEKVLVQTPIYNIFFNSIVNNGRQVIENRLLYDGMNYQIDFEELEKQLSDPQTTLMILCNPHNPIGKVWDRDTLARIGQLCFEHHVVVISDEIHCDLTDPGVSYIPFASVSDVCRENSITCIAPTKTFNLAGLQTSAISIPDKELRHKVWRGVNTDEVAEPNTFAVDAAIAAFTKGDKWLDELREYIYENKQYAMEYVKRDISELQITPSTATYLLWIDCSRISDDAIALAKSIRKNTGLYLSAGSRFSGNGESFLRMNIACPRTLLQAGMQRLKEGIRLII